MYVNIAVLASELAEDPKGLGYATLADNNQVVDVINRPGASNEKLSVASLSLAQLAACVTIGDWRNLTDVDRQYLVGLAPVGVIDVTNPTILANVEAILATPQPTQSFANLAALLQRPTSRAEILFGAGTMIDITSVMLARGQTAHP